MAPSIAITTVGGLCAAVSLLYIVYQRFVHPLAKYPGPLLASLTNFWRVYHEIIVGDLPQVIHRYHVMHGPAVRVAPNEVHFSAPDVVDLVYRKGGRMYAAEREEFYDILGSTNGKPLAVRERLMGVALEKASSDSSERVVDKHVRNLVEKLALYASSGSVLDLKTLCRFYGHDFSTESTFGTEATTQIRDDVKALPPLHELTGFEKVMRYVPWLKPYVQKYGMTVPWPYLQDLTKSRRALNGYVEDLTTREFRRKQAFAEKRGDEETEMENASFLTSLAKARDLHTGVSLSPDEVASTAFSVLVTRSQSIAASLVFLFWHLLHNPDVLRHVVEELEDESFFSKDESIANDDIATYAEMTAKLPYLSAVLRESFRVSPTIQHALPRVVPDSPTTIIADVVVPPRTTVSSSIFSLHHNHDVWGDNADYFIPERWFDNRAKQNEKYLMHFGAGNHDVMGHDQTMVAIWKAVVEVLRRFDVSLEQEEDLNETLKCEYIGFTELAGHLKVKVKQKGEAGRQLEGTARPGMLTKQGTFFGGTGMLRMDSGLEKEQATLPPTIQTEEDVVPLREFTAQQVEAEGLQPPSRAASFYGGTGALRVDSSTATPEALSPLDFSGTPIFEKNFAAIPPSLHRNSTWFGESGGLGGLKMDPNRSRSPNQELLSPTSATTTSSMSGFEAAIGNSISTPQLKKRKSARFDDTPPKVHSLPENGDGAFDERPNPLRRMDTESLLEGKLERMSKDTIRPNGLIKQPTFLGGTGSLKVDVTNVDDEDSDADWVKSSPLLVGKDDIPTVDISTTNVLTEVSGPEMLGAVGRQATFHGGTGGLMVTGTSERDDEAISPLGLPTAGMMPEVVDYNEVEDNRPTMKSRATFFGDSGGLNL